MRCRPAMLCDRRCHHHWAPSRTLHCRALVATLVAPAWHAMRTVLCAIRTTRPCASGVRGLLCLQMRVAALTPDAHFCCQCRGINSACCPVPTCREPANRCKPGFFWDAGAKACTSCNERGTTGCANCPAQDVCRVRLLAQQLPHSWLLLLQDCRVEWWPADSVARSNDRARHANSPLLSRSA